MSLHCPMCGTDRAPDGLSSVKTYICGTVFITSLHHATDNQSPACKVIAQMRPVVEAVGKAVRLGPRPERFPIEHDAAWRDVVDKYRDYKETS